MGFSVRVKGHDSWLDPESAGLLGWKLGKRLEAHCRGRAGRFITLTYDRSRYVDAQDCFDQARAQKHVHFFMRRLGKLLGRNLTGKWLCKLEFQEGGWVHWHILLMDVGFIDRELFKRIYATWGHGSINVKPATDENIRYLTKYVAKNGHVPGWVYDYPSRSVKVVRASKGFWQDEEAAKARARQAAAKNTRRKKKPRWEEPVGNRMKRQGAVFRIDQYVFSIKCRRDVLVQALRKCVWAIPRVEGRWWHYEGVGVKELEKVVAACEAASTAAVPSAGAQPNRGPRDEEPLFLRGTGKRCGWWKVCWRGRWRTLSPDAIAGRWSKWWAKHGPWWHRRAWEQEGRYEQGDHQQGVPPGARVTRWEGRFSSLADLTTVYGVRVALA